MTIVVFHFLEVIEQVLYGVLLLSGCVNALEYTSPVS